MLLAWVGQFDGQHGTGGEAGDVFGGAAHHDAPQTAPAVEAYDDEVAAALPGDLAAPYVVLPYIDDMGAAYAAADLALCRSGAMTCAELAAVGLPAIFVPLPIGNGEQRINAEHAVTAGTAVMVSDAELTNQWVASEVPALFGEPGRIERMRAAARAMSGPDAASALVAMVAAAYREAARRDRPHS